MGGDDTINVVDSAEVKGNVFGGSGADNFLLTGGFINGNIDGGLGNDTFMISGRFNSDGTIIGGENSDNIEINGANMEGVIIYGHLSDTVAQSNADDTVFMRAGAVANSVVTSSGNDFIRIQSSKLVNEATGISSGAGDDEIIVNGLSDIIGSISAGDSSINGTTAADRDRITLAGTAMVRGNVDGNAGDDLITMEGPGATVMGDVRGGAASDEFVIKSGSIGGDLETGDDGGIGTASDTVDMSGGTISGDIVSDAGGDIIMLTGGVVAGQFTDINGGGDDQISVSDAMIGPSSQPTVTAAILMGAGDDTVTINSGAIVHGDIVGGADDDIIDLVSGSVTGAVQAGSGNDIVTLTATTLSTVTGGDIIGGTGQDIIAIQGGRAKNVFTGTTDQSQTDGDTITMTGGTVGQLFGDDGADTFTLSGGVVTGIRGNGGQDLITISGTAAVTGNIEGDNSTNLTKIATDEITIDGGLVSGSIDAGPGADIININGGVVRGSVFSGAGSDRIFLTGGSIGDGTSNGISVNDFINAGGGDDFVTIDAAFSLTDINEVDTVTKISGGDNFDRLLMNTAAGAFRDINEENLANFEIINFDSNATGFISIDGGSGITLDTGGGAGSEIKVTSGTFHLASSGSDIRAETVTFAQGTLLSGTGTVIATNSLINGDHSVGSSPGIMSLVSDVTYGGTASVFVEFSDLSGNDDDDIRPWTPPGGPSSPDRGIEFDAINITGNLTIMSGATLQIAFIDELAADMLAVNGGGIMENDIFDIFNVSGSITGDFTLITDGTANVSDFGFTWQIYNENGIYGIQLVQLVSVTEPATALLMTGGLFGAIRLRRRIKTIRWTSRAVDRR